MHIDRLSWSILHNLQDLIETERPVFAQYLGGIIYPDIHCPSQRPQTFQGLFCITVAVPIKMYRTSMGFVPNRKGEVTQNNTDLAHVYRPQIVALIEKMADLVGLIVIAPNDVDILALDAIAIELTPVAISISWRKGEVTQNPQRITRTNHSVDVIRDMIVHHIDGITSDAPGGGAFAFPFPYMPFSAVSLQGPSVKFGKEWSVAIFDDVAVPEVRHVSAVKNTLPPTLVPFLLTIILLVSILSSTTSHTPPVFQNSQSFVVIARHNSSGQIIDLFALLF